ncbi:MAG: hypothetical protein RLZ98_3696 [Pseudomonadota bacterium]
MSAFDGIICIGGEDWWYHNRGHFDFQIMRRLAKRWPVLFVNSIGVRVPSVADKRVFLQRVGRKLKSLTRGLKEVEPGFHVYSPLSLPGSVGHKWARWALVQQIKSAARRIGIERPLLWVHCPAGAGLEVDLGALGMVLQRTDRFEAYPEGDHELLSRQIAHLKARADLVVYSSDLLLDEEVGQVGRSMLVTHGVDLETFARAGDQEETVPFDVEPIRGPRVGFIGGMDAHTFDPTLFHEVAERLHNVSFVMVGGSSLPEDWCTLRNVHFLGQKPYDEVAAYMAAMDVLIMPWNRSPWIEACNPIKLKEYLAVGRPVVSTDFKALDPWRSFIRVAGNADCFSAAIAEALDSPLDTAEVRRLLVTESWEHKAAEIARELESIPCGNRTDSARTTATQAKAA